MTRPKYLKDGGIIYICAPRDTTYDDEVLQIVPHTLLMRARIVLVGDKNEVPRIWKNRYGGKDELPRPKPWQMERP